MSWPATATRPPRPGPLAAADFLCAHGAPRHLDQALFAYNHSPAYVARVKQLARRYTAPGGGRR